MVTSGTAPAGTPIGVALADLARRAPDAAAVTDPRRTVSRRELEQRTNRLARAYAARGGREGDFVTIALPNGIEFVEAAIATWKLGATPQPLSHRLPERELRSIVDLVAPKLVVGLDADSGAAHVPAGFEPAPELDDQPLPPAIAPSLKAPTSGGSTGTPKIIVSTEPAVAEGLTGLAALLRMSDSSVVLCTGPLSHNGPFLFSLAGLLLGVHVVVMDRFDAEQALELVQRHRVTWMYSVPTMLHRFVKLPAPLRERFDLTTLRTVVTMAAPCAQWLKEACVAWLGPDRLLELYAATEAHAATVIDGHGWLARPGSVGRPVMGQISVRDSDGTELPSGGTGEIWMRRSTDLAAPYRYIGARPRVSTDGWESVGDRGRLDADGYLYLADRMTDMIIVGGSNVYPAEVEAVLEEHPDVHSACVIGLPDEEYGQVPHAVVQTDSAAFDADALTSYLRSRIAPYKVPRSYEFTSEPLRDEAGKLRRALHTQRPSRVYRLGHSGVSGDRAAESS
ncbi:AMP-binding protein [Actinophytocola sp. NPDC049390]|uniref:AMP-binding protein n=1 Tax=Actinophytocola sp. NPDC049390 TaxID=3363894 RepID=UPI0037888A8D